MSEEMYPAQFKIIPTGEYQVVFDGKVLGKFGSLMAAQDFQSKLGTRGSRIVAPNLRKNMSEDDIRIAQNLADNWGRKDNYGPHRS